MSKISYYTKVHLSKCNGSWVVSTKQTMNFNIQTAAILVFFVFDKNGLMNGFWMVEGTGLKSTASGSPSMALPPYWIS
jgi:hypothetical protein